MNRVHWFNPENDLALAVNAPNYTPKKAAQNLHNAGALLPLWYGDSGDTVLCYGVNADWYDKIVNDFNIAVDVFDHVDTSQYCPDPWGWSMYTKRFFVDEGFGVAQLPSDHEIDVIRELSHRRTTAVLIDDLHRLIPEIKLADAAFEAFNKGDVEAWLSKCPDAYVKHPWSGSGRGVLHTTSASAEAVLKFADDAIRRQGSVMLERAYRRVIDFACLYECREGSCQSLGTSVFTTDEHNAYSGNVLAPEAVRAAMVAKHLPESALSHVSESIHQVVETKIDPVYNGVLGVDMFVADDGTLAVSEVNLRKTMGYVANRFADRYLHPSAQGFFNIIPISTLTTQSVYQTADHRLISGSLLLTPPNPHFAIQAVCKPT